MKDNSYEYPLSMMIISPKSTCITPLDNLILERPLLLKDGIFLQFFLLDK